MKLDVKQLRRIVREEYLREAVKEKTEVDQAVDDLLRGTQDLGSVPFEILPAVEQKMKERAAQELGDPTRGGMDLSDFEGMSGEDILAILQALVPPEDFSFEQEFQKGLDQPRASFRGATAGVGRSTARQNVGQGDQDIPLRGQQSGQRQPLFQPNMPWDQGQPGLRRINRRQVATEVERVLMDEFVAPAMGLGANILPAVWSELGRLMNADPQGFMPAFQVALNMIRETENAWFANLLGIGTPEPTSMNVTAEVKATADRIRKVLDMYYEAVLKEAARNSENLISRLQEIESSTTREEFEQGFFDAMSKTRDVEDKAFAMFMGGPRRLR